MKKKETRVFEHGKHMVLTQNHTTTGLLYGMFGGMFYDVCWNQNRIGMGMSIGMCLGLLIGTNYYSKISNASIKYLNDFKTESQKATDYLEESKYIDYSNELIQTTTQNLLQPLNEKIIKEFEPYLEGFYFFRDEHAALTGYSVKEVRKARIEWENAHPDIMSGKNNRWKDNYWKNVEKAHEIWQTGAVKRIYEFVRDEIPHTFDEKSDTITAKASEVLEAHTGVCHAKANLLAAMLRYTKIPCGLCFERITLEDDDSKGYCLHAFNAVYVDMQWVFLDARGNKPGINAQYNEENQMLAFYPRNNYDEYFVNGIYINPHEETMNMLENADNLNDILEDWPSDESSLYQRLK